MNYAQLIADTVDAGEPTADYAGEIVRETERVATIVRNLLQFARQEKQAHSPARLADIVEQTLSLLRAVLRRDQITLTVDVPEDLPAAQVPEPAAPAGAHEPPHQRPGRPEREVPRLPPGQERSAITAREIRHLRSQGPEAAGPQSQILQAGRGCGSVADHRASASRRRSRPGSSIPSSPPSPGTRGTGLGLSISHGIVQDHHGRLDFETEAGCGHALPPGPAGGRRGVAFAICNLQFAIGEWKETGVLGPPNQELPI